MINNCEDQATISLLLKAQTHTCVNLRFFIILSFSKNLALGQNTVSLKRAGGKGVSQNLGGGPQKSGHKYLSGKKWSGGIDEYQAQNVRQG